VVISPFMVLVPATLIDAALNVPPVKLKFPPVPLTINAPMPLPPLNTPLPVIVNEFPPPVIFPSVTVVPANVLVAPVPPSVTAPV